MLTKKRKLRNRKQLYLRLFIVAGLFLVGLAAGYGVSLKLFQKNSYLSPLAKEAVAGATDDEEKTISLITQSFSKEKITIKSVIKKDNTYIVVLESGGEIIFSSKKDLITQISSLQFILQRLTMEGRRFTRLDLSFDKPVIVLEK